MNKTNKDMANVGLAGVAVGAAVGVATAVLFSDKKRRESIINKAEKIKTDLVDSALKFKDQKVEEAEEIKEVTKGKVTKVAEDISSEKN